MTPERSGNPRPLKASGDTERSGNPRPTRKTLPERVPTGSLEPYGINPNRPPDAKNWSNLCRTVWAIINNPSLLVGRDNSIIIFPEIPQKGAGSSTPGSSSSSSGSSSSSSSSSSSGSSGSSSGPSSSGSEPSGSEPSTSAPSGDDSGSDKSTAIVPAPWLPSGYAALFCLEAPEVRFDDVLTVELWKKTSMVPIDHRFSKVCQKNSIRVCGSNPDQPVMVAALPPVDDFLWVRLDWPWFKRPSWPVTVTIRLTGIRKGFAGKRFPARTQAQFEANEKFINSAYPGTPSPPETP